MHFTRVRFATRGDLQSQISRWLAEAWYSNITAHYDDDDEGRINFSVALSPKTTRTRNNKPKQWSHVIVVSAMRRY